MENDKTFKTLIENGIEKASPDFTRLVISRIKTNAAVNNKWKKIYRLTFVAISFLVVALSFLNKPAQRLLDIDIAIPGISGRTGFWIILYIFSFWMLIAVSFRMEKRKAVNP